MRRNPDEELRDLERQAALGDPAAHRRLCRARQRRGLPSGAWTGARRLSRRAARAPHVFMGTSVAAGADHVFEQLSIDEIAYANRADQGRHRGFGAIHDFCDANSLIPHLNDVHGNDQWEAFLVWASAVAEEVNRRFLQTRPARSRTSRQAHLARLQRRTDNGERLVQMHNPDEGLRDLERRVATGDRTARHKLAVARRRLGLPDPLWRGARRISVRALTMQPATRGAPYLSHLERVARALTRRHAKRKQEVPGFPVTHAMGATVRVSSPEELEDGADLYLVIGLPCPNCGSRNTYCDADLNERGRLNIYSGACNDCGAC